MGESQDTAHLTRILLTLFFLVLIIGLLSSSPHNVFAQHKIVPENWIGMRKMLRNKGPIPTIEGDVATLAGGDGKWAAIRLIDRGPHALPAVHAALRSPEDKNPVVEYSLFSLLESWAYVGRNNHN